MAENHIKIENSLLECLVRLQMISQLLEYPQELYDRMEESKKLIETKQYNVAVMGGI